MPGSLLGKLGVDHRDRNLLAVLLQQALAEKIDGVQTAARCREGTKQPSTDADQGSGAHQQRLPLNSLRDRKASVKLTIRQRDDLDDRRQTPPETIGIGT